MEALQEAERTGEAGPLVALFADEVELSKLAAPAPDRGREGAGRFWRAYLGDFEHIRSTFTRVIEGAGAAALEWVSEGAVPGGRAIRYAGVSLVQIEGDRVRRFRTYYDSAAFVSPFRS